MGNEERVRDGSGPGSSVITIIIDESRCNSGWKGLPDWNPCPIWVVPINSSGGNINAPTAVKVGINLIPQLTRKISEAAKFRPKSSTGCRVSGSKLAWHVVEPVKKVVALAPYLLLTDSQSALKHVPQRDL